MDIKRYLAHLSDLALGEIGQHRGIPYSYRRTPDRADRLAERLLDRGWLAKQIEELSATQRAVLHDVRRHGGRTSAAELAKAMADDGVESAGWALNDLLARGLLLQEVPEGRAPKGNMDLWKAHSWGRQQEQDRILFVSPELDELMGPVSPPPPPLPEEPPAHLEEYPGEATITRTPFADAMRDLFAIYQAVRTRPLGLRQDGDIRKPDLVRLNKAIAPTEPVYGDNTSGRSDFLFSLAFDLGLLRTSKDETAFEAVPEGLEFFGLPAAERLRRLLDAWQKQDSWSELARVLMVYSGYRHEPPDAKKRSAARGVLVETLKVPDLAGKWTSVASLLRVVKREHREILFRHRVPRFPDATAADPYAMPYRGVHTQGTMYRSEPLFDKRRDWEKVEGAFLVSALREPLQWLGLVEIGLDSERQPVAFRLTAEGAVALGLAAEVAPAAGETTRALVVQPNFEMVFLPEVAGFAAAIALDRFADRVSMDRAIIYRLSRESVLRGLREGLPREEVLATLERLSGGPLPQNVRYSLEEWVARFGSIRLHRKVMVLAAEDAAGLDAALKSAGIGDARPLGAGAALLPIWRESLKSLRSLRGARWYDYAAEIPKVVKVEEDGRLVVPEKDLTPYLRYRLEQFARPAGKAAFELDEERFRGALRAGLRASEVEQLLSEAATGPLPPRVRLSLRGWGGAYRDIGLAPVSAMSAPPEVLDLLLGIAGFREHVLARPAPTLALVDPAKAKALRKVLDQFGLFVRDQLELQRPAAAGPLAEAEPVYTLPPREMRSLLERAIAEHRAVALLVL